MIITQEFLVTLGAKTEWVDFWIESVGQSTAKTTIENLKNTTQTEFYKWALYTFNTDRAILLSDHMFADGFGTRTEQGIVEFEDFSSAEEKQSATITEIINSVDYMFSINAITNNADGSTTVKPCKSELAGAAKYEAFDHFRGIYLPYDTFVEAKAFSDFKLEEYTNLLKSQFKIVKKIQDSDREFEAWVECFYEDGILKARSADKSITKIIP